MKKKSILLLMAFGLLINLSVMAKANKNQTEQTTAKQVCFFAYILDSNGDRIGYHVFDCDTGVGMDVYY